MLPSIVSRRQWVFAEAESVDCASSSTRYSGAGICCVGVDGSSISM